MKKVIIAFVLSMFAVQAHAWGDREQGILVGIGSAILVDKILDSRSTAPAPHYPPMYGSTFPPFVCHASEIECAYQKGVYDRQLREYENMKRRAYACGRYGRCE